MIVTFKKLFKNCARTDGSSRASNKVKPTRRHQMGDPSTMEYCFKNQMKKQHADPDLNSLLEFFQSAGTLNAVDDFNSNRIARK